MTDRYLIKLEEKIREIGWIIRDYSLTIEQPEFTDLLNIKGSITFFDGSIFTFSELIAGKPISYRFHLMTADKQLIRRWDSAPHHRELKSFPFHLHTTEGVFESRRINLLQAIDKVIETLLQNIIPDF